MRFLSLFSGIEAATAAWEPLGWQCAAVAEVEPFPCALLKHHYPEVPNLGDVTKITAEQVKALGRIDMVCGGFPCQDLSVAGKRKGLNNADGTATRSGLFFDAMRIADWANPRWLFIENVPGMFSSNSGRDFAAVVGEMAGCEFAVPRDGWRNAGVVVGPRGLVEWSVMDAQYHGLAQRRKRVFIVRDSGDWANRQPIFLESYRMQGHPAPRRQAGQGATRGVEFGPSGGRFTDVNPTLDSRAKDGPIRNQLAGAVATLCVATGQAGAEIGAEIAPTLNCNHEAPYVMRPSGVTIHGTDKTAKVASFTDIAGCLRARAPGSQENSSTTVVVQPVAASFKGGQGAKAYGIRTAQTSSNGWGIQEEVTHTLDGALGIAVAQPVSVIAFDTTQMTSAANRSNPKVGDPCHPLAAQAHVPCIAFPERMSGTQCAPTENLAPALGALNPTAIAFNMHKSGNEASSLGISQDRTDCLRAFEKSTFAVQPSFGIAVRRLLPVECERLMGFPDGYTAIPHRGKPAADGPRYKALGNSWAVPCAAWIGKRISEVAA